MLLRPYTLPLPQPKVKESANGRQNAPARAQREVRSEMPECANDDARGHALLPDEVAAKIPEIGTQDGLGGEATALVKFFGSGRWTLFVTEYDGADLLFGYVLSPLDPDFDEFGSASLSEVAERRHAVLAWKLDRGSYHQRDLDFEPVSVFEAVDQAEKMGAEITKRPVGRVTQ